MSFIGQKLSELRAKRGWTLKFVSSKTGISVSHLSAIENGTRQNPSFQNVVRLADLYQVPLTYFVDEPDIIRSESLPVQAEQDNEAWAEARLEHPDFPSSSSTVQLASTLSRLYDVDTQSFIAAESSRPYVVLAKELADRKLTLDSPTLLQLIARFMRERELPYDGTKAPSSY